MDEILTLKSGTTIITYYLIRERGQYCDEDYDIKYFTTFSEARKFLIAWLLRTQKITRDDLQFSDVVDGEHLSIDIGERSSCFWEIIRQRKIIYASADEAEFMMED